MEERNDGREARAEDVAEGPGGGLLDRHVAYDSRKNF